MAQRLSFKYGKKDYEKINNAIGQETKKALIIILDQYESLVRHIIFSYTSESIRELISLEKDPQKRGAIWKGIIMTNFIQMDNLKQYLLKLLKELSLPEDIKLKEFYDVCPVRLDITITAVNMSSHVIEFINRHTYPEMPVWAAILTATAFPSLFQPVRAKSSWC
jgi:predicted acylesterase/phospholipase RssA